MNKYRIILTGTGLIFACYGCDEATNATMNTGSTGGNEVVEASDANACLGEGTPNLDCPPLGPYDGACAAHGPCCQRSSNSVVEATLGADEPLTLEYRIQGSSPINNLTGVGFPSIAATVATRGDIAAVNNLLRIKLPRQSGQLSAGSGEFTHGYGRYNCDGTYSYYSDTAAPTGGLFTDPARFAPVTETFEIGSTYTEDASIWSSLRDLPSQTAIYPVLNDGTFELDWELVERDMIVTSMDFSGAGKECIGAREGANWNFAGRYESFMRLDEVDQQVIANISQTDCDLLAFGLISVDDAESVNCAGPSERCLPGTEGCLWRQLPDSLCPVTANEQTLFRCHLGAAENPNMEPDYPSVTCDSQGPCCDPLGASTSLPACNAFRLVREFVASAVNILDEPASQLQPQCL